MKNSDNVQDRLSMTTDSSGFVLRLLSSTDSLQSFLNKVYEKFKLPIIVTDIAFNLVAYAGPRPCTDPLWERIVAYGAAAPETVINEYFADGFTDKMVSSDGSIDASWGTNADYPQTTCSIKIKGIVEGCCSVLYMDKEKLDFALNLNTALAEAASIYFGLKGPRNLDNYKPERVTLASFLLESVCAPISLIYSTNFYKEERFCSKYMVAVISAPGANHGRLQNVINNIKAKHSSMLYLHKGEDVYIFFWNIKSEKDKQLLLQYISEDAEKKVPVICGVSCLFEDPEKRGLYVEQAKLAADYGKQHCKPNTSRILYFFDYYFDILLELGYSNISSGNLVLPEISALIEYDAENNTNFYKSLECYLEEYCDLSATASKLFIHRNSLLYRIKKCEEIMRVDLRDSDTRKRMAMSCKVVSMISNE